MKSLSSHQVGVLFIVLSCIAYGMLPVTLRLIYQQSTLNPTDVAIWRYLFAVPLIWAATRLLPRPAAKAKAAPYRVPLAHLAFLGALYGTSVLLAFFGLQRLPVGVFLLLFYTYPAMVAFAAWFGGEPLSRLGWLALGLTMIGAMLTISDTDPTKAIDALGLVIALGHAVSVAVFFIAAGRLLRGAGDTARNTAWQLTATLVFLLCTIPIFGFQVPQTAGAWVGLLVLASVSTGLPIFALNAGIQRIGPAQAAIIGTLEPVIGIFMAFLVLSEVILPLQFVGTVLILAAVVFIAAETNTLKLLKQMLLSSLTRPYKTSKLSIILHL